MYNVVMKKDMPFNGFGVKIRLINKISVPGTELNRRFLLKVQNSADGGIDYRHHDWMGSSRSVYPMLIIFKVGVFSHPVSDDSVVDTEFLP